MPLTCTNAMGPSLGFVAVVDSNGLAWTSGILKRGTNVERGAYLASRQCQQWVRWLGSI